MKPTLTACLVCLIVIQEDPGSIPGTTTIIIIVLPKGRSFTANSGT